MDVTRESVLAMPAGPEMDALVAERVLGCSVEWRAHLGVVPLGKWPRCACPGSPHRDVYEEGLTGHVATFSDDINSAWRVVAHLAAGPWRVTIGRNAETWTVEFDTAHYAPGAPPCATAGTAPLAICRAALLTTL
jgi:hypothetical protein